MDFAPGPKRGRPEAALNGYGSVKKSKQEMESISTGIGSKSKPCTKFFSTSGCPFGESCHFLHYVPGGFKAMPNHGSNLTVPPIARNQMAPPSFPDGSSPPSVKTRLCNKYNTAEGCRFGDKCHFAHGEMELGKPTALHKDSHAMGAVPGRFGWADLPSPGMGPAASFGTSAAAKISVDASLAGAIIGKGGVNSKHICRVTGAKLAIRDHESDPNLRNIELEGTFDQIKHASALVHELLVDLGSASGHPMRNPAMPPSTRGSNFKTRACENFARGSCTFGERCHFAHSADEMRRQPM